MKFPHLNLLFFIALLAFTSCEKEATAIPEEEATHDISMRCCEDAVSDMLEDPRFVDFYDEFTNGTYVPTISLFDQFDSDKLSNELSAFEACTTSGSSAEYCIEQSGMLSRLIAIINGFDVDMLNTLYEDYHYLDREEFNSTFLKAIAETSQNSYRGLPCFQQFRVEVAEVFLAGGGVAATGIGTPVAVATLAVGLIIARLRYCNCLYATYGAQC